MQLFGKRDSLYKLIWSKPVKEIATDHHVSEQAVIAKCIELQVPRPMQGYWRAVAKGIAPRIPALPPVKRIKANGSLPSSDIVETSSSDETAASKSTHPIVKNKKRKSVYPTVSGAYWLQTTKDILLKSQVTRLGFYKPTKRKLLDLNVSNTGFVEAERFLLKFFDSIEKHGLVVRLGEASENFRRRDISACEDNNQNFFYPSLWYPSNESVISIQGICVGFSLVEMTEYVPAKEVGGRYVRDEKMISWSRGKNCARLGYYRREHIPCGRYRLQLYSPYEPEGWFKVFNQTKTRSLVSQISEILKETYAAVPVIKAHIQAEKERVVAWSLQVQQELIEREKRNAIKRKEEAYKTSIAELQQIMATWAEDLRVEKFFTEAENEIQKCPPALREQLRERLNAARAFLKGESAMNRLLKWRTPDERLD